MSQRKFVIFATSSAVLFLCLSTVWHSAAINAQTDESIAEMKQRVAALMKQTKFTEALPLLEKALEGAEQIDNAGLRRRVRSQLDKLLSGR